MRRLTAVLVGVGLFVLVVALPALGHGDFESARPGPGSDLATPPSRLAITLTEPPAPGTVLRVFDGCGRDLVAAPSRSDRVIETRLAQGQPGRWRVQYRAISAVDGHSTRGSYRFTVRGRRDCTSAKKSPQISGGEDTLIESDDPPEETTDFPIVPFALGSIAVIAVAVVLRGIASR